MNRVARFARMLVVACSAASCAPAMEAGKPAGASGGAAAPGRGAATSGGAPGTGGAVAGAGGALGSPASGSGGATGLGGADSGMSGASASNFSFFVTSVDAMRARSGSETGFGGDLRVGEATGLAGADKICREVAKRGMPGAETKTWRAFLSVYGPPAVNAIDRVGPGPWYDRLGRLVALTKAGLAMTRPQGGDATITDDLPNETGMPNHQGVDNHDTLTGSTMTGMLQASSAAGTCNDWTSAVGTTGRPMLGHSWPARSGMSWIQAHPAGGCAAGVNLVQAGGPTGTDVGSGGGYGGIYCFALLP